MRAHGVVGLANPAPSDLKAELAPATPHSPAFQAAFPGCSHLLPFGAPHETEAQTRAQKPHSWHSPAASGARAFPSFPDPSTNGQITHEMVANAGIKLDQPAVLQAGDACVGVTHGFITKAIVARFVAGH